jgi:hypothetical protein
MRCKTNNHQKEQCAFNRTPTTIFNDRSCYYMDWKPFRVSPGIASVVMGVDDVNTLFLLTNFNIHKPDGRLE